MATIEELEQKLRKAHEAGDSYAAGIFAQAIRDQMTLKREPQGEAHGKPGWGMRYLEPALTMGSAALSVPVSGLAGLAMGGDADVVANVQEAMTYEPRTPEGKKGLADLAYTMEPVANAYEDMSNTVAEGAYRQTGSPLAASIAKGLPDVVLTASGLRGAVSAAPKVAKSVPKVAKGYGKVMDTIDDFQTPANKQRALALQQGSRDIDLAGYKLGKTRTGKPKALKDSLANQALKQGYDKGVIASIYQSSRADKNKMIAMLNEKRMSIRDKRYGMENRPSDVIGQIYEEKGRLLANANKRYANQLDAVAKSLKGQPVDVSQEFKAFGSVLDDMGVKIGDDLSVIFKGSDVEGSKGAINALNNLWARVRSDMPMTDAYDVHRFKKFIDETVSYSKKAEGLSGKMEGVIKKLRHDLDTKLDSTFKQYNIVNTGYADTKQAIDAFMDVAGRKFNPNSPNADKFVGKMMRKIGSNYAVREQLMDAVRNLESTLKKHSKGNRLLSGTGEGSNDIYSLTMFANELDRMFKPSGQNTFAGQIGQEIGRMGRNATMQPQQTAADAFFDSAGRLVDKARGVNDEAAIQAMRRYLSQ